MTSETKNENEKIIEELIDENIVTLVAKEVIKKLNLKFPEEEEKHFILILLALMKSVPADALKILICEDEKEIKKKVEKAKEELDKNEMDENFIFCSDHEKRISSQLRYYETEFEKRKLIQNYDWNYPGLSIVEQEEYEDVDLVMDTETEHWGEIVAREETLYDFEDFLETKWEGPECSDCGRTKGKLRGEKIICRNCYNYRGTYRFADICCFFRIIGDMAHFVRYLSKETKLFIFNNKYFREETKNRKHVPFNCIKLYAKLRKAIKESENETIEIKKREDEIKEKSYLRYKRLGPKLESENLKKSK